MARVERIATRIGFELEDCASSSGFLYQLLAILFAVSDWKSVRYTSKPAGTFEYSAVAEIATGHCSHKKQLNEIAKG